MKLVWLFISILFITLIQTNTAANAYPMGTPSDLPIPVHSSELQQAINQKLQESLTQSKEQHAQDLQIIAILCAIIIGLTCVVIALSIVFLKNRRISNHT